MKTSTDNPNKITGAKFSPPSLEEMAARATIGRRESPPPENPKQKYWVLGRSIILGAIVVAFVVALILVLVTTSENPFNA